MDISAKGHTSEEEQHEGSRDHVREQRYGEFSRSIHFPSQVDAEKIHAGLSRGMLTLQVLKVEAAKPRHITVKGA